MRRVAVVGLVVALPLVAISIYVPWLLVRLFATNPPAATSTMPLPATSPPAALPLVAKPAPRPATVATTGLRVRSCPDYECQTVDWLQQGDK